MRVADAAARRTVRGEESAIGAPGYGLLPDPELIDERSPDLIELVVAYPLAAGLAVESQAGTRGGRSARWQAGSASGAVSRPRSRRSA